MRWISVKEKLPPVDSFVITWGGPDTEVCMLEYNGDYFGLCINGQNCQVNVTHWMPLPNPPTFEKNKGFIAPAPSHSSPTISQPAHKGGEE